MIPDLQLPKDVFDALPPAAQAYIRFLEARVQQLEEQNCQQAIRTSQL